MMMKKKRQLTAWASVLMTVAATSAGIAGLASAHTYPRNQCTGSTVCEPDNNDHTYCDASNMGNNNYGQALQSHVNYMDGLSNFRVRRHNTCGDQTDVYAYSTYDLGWAGLAGQYYCWRIKSAGSGYECDSAVVRLDDSIFAATYPTSNTNQRRFMQKVWCHEFGHSVGLYHTNDLGGGCMTRGSQLDTGTSWNKGQLHSRRRSYNDHDEKHIKNDLDDVI